MALVDIRDNITRGEDGEILRFIPNIGNNGEVLSNVIEKDFIYVKDKNTSRNFFFTDDDNFPIITEIKGQYFSNRNKGIDVGDIQLNFSKRYFSNVLTEDKSIKIFQFGKTILDILHNYESDKKLFDPRDGIALKIKKSEVNYKNPFSSFDDTKIIELEPYSIGDDNLSVASFIMNNRKISMDDYFMSQSWYGKGQSTRDVLNVLSKLGDDLSEYLKKFNREYIIDDLLGEGE
jgi:hypothetical protein